VRRGCSATHLANACGNHRTRTWGSLGDGSLGDGRKWHFAKHENAITDLWAYPNGAIRHAKVPLQPVTETPKCRFLAQTPLHQTTARSANHTTECSSMRTARPPHSFFELRAHPFDMLPPCLIFLDGDGPADPLVARERRYVFPSRQCLRVGRDRLSEVSRKVMYDSSGDSNGCHRLSRKLKDQASDTRVQLGFPDYRDDNSWTITRLRESELNMRQRAVLGLPFAMSAVAMTANRLPGPFLTPAVPRSFASAPSDDCWAAIYPIP
jgi:hypothetical protein